MCFALRLYERIYVVQRDLDRSERRVMWLALCSVCERNRQIEQAAYEAACDVLRNSAIIFR